MPGNANGLLHWSDELETSDLAWYFLNENPHYSHGANDTEVNQGAQDPAGKTHSLWSLLLYSIFNIYSTSG